MCLTSWLAQPIFRGENLRADRYHEATPGEVGRLEQIMDDQFNLQQVRLPHWGGIISDITYGPDRPANEVAVEHNSLSSSAAWGCGNIPRRVTTLPLTEFLQNTRGPPEEYAVTRLKVVPAAREKRAAPQKIAPRNETEALRQRQGIYRGKRHIDQEELRRQNPYAQKSTWELLRIEVKAFREHIDYDSDQEEANANDAIRKNKYGAYEERQEMRRQCKNHRCITHRMVGERRTQGLTSHNNGRHKKHPTHQSNIQYHQCANTHRTDPWELLLKY